MAHGGTSEATFLEHVSELRTRLFLSVGGILGGSILGYLLLDQIMYALGRPIEQTLYYSAPTGELSFLIKVCVIFGVIVASPLVLYQIIQFIQPLFSRQLKKRVLLYIFASLGLAASGVLFAYFLSLPLMLRFLLTISNDNSLIQPLISADEYFNFVLSYIAGYALLFQIPLFVVLFNRIKPLTPSGIFKSLRFIVLFSFIAAAIITPTPDPVNQAIMALPVIVLYLFSALLLVIPQELKKMRRTTRPAQPAAAQFVAPFVPESSPQSPVPAVKQPSLAVINTKQQMPSPSASTQSAAPRPRQYFDFVPNNPQRARPVRRVQKISRAPVQRQPIQRLITDFI